MTGRPVLPYHVRKEISALVPTWGASAAAIAVAAFWRDSRLLTLAAFAYGLGCIALGAQSFGQEYAHRTIGLLLSQPASRRRLFFVKIATLAAMLAALTIVAWPVVFADDRWSRMKDDARSVLALAAISSLCIVPVLSILCRNVLAAIVLTLAIPGTLIVTADVVGVALYGVEQAARVDRFKYAIFWRGMFAICAIAAAACWWLFTRLEAIEGRGAEFHLPGWLTRQPASISADGRSSPAWQLVIKELRLQQVTGVVVFLYVIAYFIVARIARTTPAVADPVPAMSMLYGALLAMLIGALASAEERQLGTLEWQTLLPMPSWRQWAVKTGVVGMLVLVLGVALPYALRMLSPVPGDRLEHGPPTEVLNAIVIVLALTSVCLYVSSLSASGVRALVMSLPVLAMAAVAINLVAWGMAVAIRSLGFAAAFRSAAFAVRDAPTVGWVAICLGFVALAVSFAAINHRSVERPVTRIALQASTMIAYASVVVMLLQQ